MEKEELEDLSQLLLSVGADVQIVKTEKPFEITDTFNMVLMGVGKWKDGMITSLGNMGYKRNEFDNILNNLPYEVQSDIDVYTMKKMKLELEEKGAQINIFNHESGKEITEEELDSYNAQIKKNAERLSNALKEVTPTNNEPKCPRCGGTQLSANKKGYGLGKAALGGVLLGPVGLLGGFVGSGEVKITCLKCGHVFRAGK